MISMFPIRNQLNNGILNSQKAMPQKAITSTNDSNFAMNRRAYVDSHFESPDQPLVKPVQTQSFGFKGFVEINHGLGGKASTAQKKWMGGSNRDASDIIARRRINSVGNGSLNAAGQPMAFKTVKDNNTERQAYHRVRSGGSAVPAKCTHKYENAPIFY